MKNFKIGSTNVTVKRINNKAVVLGIVNNEVGKKVYIALTMEQLKSVYDFIKDGYNVEDIAVNQNTISGIPTKWREYTQCVDEQNPSYKYYEEKCDILLIRVSNQIIISIRNSSREIAGVSFDRAFYNLYIEEIKKHIREFLFNNFHSFGE